MADERRFRILHLASSERWTGVADPATGVAAQQQRDGHEVWLACVPGQSFEHRAAERGLRVVREFHLDRRLHPLNFVGDLIAIRRFVRRHQVDVVHSHLANDNWLAALALLGARRPFVLARTFHRWQPTRADPLHRWLYGRRNDLTITTSRSLLAQFEGRVTLRRGIARVIYGGVDCERFNPDVSGDRVRRGFGLSPETPVAGIVARLTHGRGHRWLFQAVPELVKRLPQARVFVAGLGELKKALKAETASTPLHENVIMSGYRSYQDLPETYAAFDVALFLGMGSEGTCRAALEAMATGRPVIAVNAAALPEIVEHGKSGLLVEPDNVQALTDAMVRLLSDRAECVRMGRQARLAVLDRFTEQHRAQATVAAYCEAWQAKTGSRSFSTG